MLMGQRLQSRKVGGAMFGFGKIDHIAQALKIPTPRSQWIHRHLLQWIQPKDRVVNLLMRR